jgi:probable rRNA maturation factor
VEVSVLLADDATVRSLNRTYRGEERATDVLAFPQDGQGGMLGDVVISVEQAARQARRARHPLLREVALLAIHGTLHLLGYEDHTPRGRRAMWAAQRRLLRAWGARTRR